AAATAVTMHSTEIATVVTDGTVIAIMVTATPFMDRATAITRIIITATDIHTTTSTTAIHTTTHTLLLASPITRLRRTGTTTILITTIPITTARHMPATSTPAARTRAMATMITTARRLITTTASDS